MPTGALKRPKVFEEKKAKASANLPVLTKARDKSLSNICDFSNALEVARAIKGDEMTWGCLAPSFEKSWRPLNFFDTVKFSFVPRECSRIGMNLSSACDFEWSDSFSNQLSIYTGKRSMHIYT